MEQHENYGIGRACENPCRQGSHLKGDIKLIIIEIVGQFMRQSAVFGGSSMWDWNHYIESIGGRLAIL